MRTDERILRIDRGGDLNASSDDGRRFSLADIHSLVTRHRRLESLSGEIRGCEDKAERRLLKKGLPSVEFNSVCGGLRRIGNVVSMTGLVVIDIDGLESASQAERVRDNLFNDTRLGCVLAFVSVSGLGVKAVLDIGRDRVTTDNIKDWYAAAGWYLRSTYSLDIDTDACDAVRLCFLSHDADARLAEEGRVSAIDLSWGGLVRKKASVKPDVPRMRSAKERTALGQLLVDFADLCDERGLCFLHDYAIWLGLGVNIRLVLGHTDEALECWDKCSRHSHKYNRRDLLEKWNLLPEGSGGVTVLEMLGNFAKSPLCGDTDLRGWLHNEKARLGLGTTRVSYK